TAGDTPPWTTTNGGRTWIGAPFLHQRLGQAHTYGPGQYRAFGYRSFRMYSTSNFFYHVDSTRPLFDSTTDPQYLRGVGSVLFSDDSTIIACGTYRVKSVNIPML